LAANVTAGMVKELREKTGAGMMDCKKALLKTEGDLEKAVEVLREEGLAEAQKKRGRTAAEGRVDSYIHLDGKIGVLLEVNCETDFVARNEEFKELVNDIAMQIAAMNPEYIAREDVPEEVVEREKEILRNQAMKDGKPEHIVDKIVEGRLEKFFSGVCLLEQEFIKDEDRTVDDVIKEAIADLGENIRVRRFERFELGAGLETEDKDFAQEVREEMGG